MPLPDTMQGDAQVLETPRLERYVDVNRMKRLAEQMSRDFDTGMGILGLEGVGDSLKLYPIVERVHFKTFCDLIRCSTMGRDECARADLQCALRAKGDNIERVCHAGLIDIAAPIIIKNRPVAFLFAGQIRYQEITVKEMMSLRSLYESYRINETTLESGTLVSYEEFLYHFLSIVRKSREEIDRVKRRLQELADTISNFAQYSHYLASVQVIGQQLVPVRDLNSGLDRVLKVVLDIFGGRETGEEGLSASIWQLTETQQGKHLECVRASSDEFQKYSPLRLSSTIDADEDAMPLHHLCEAVSRPVRYNAKIDMVRFPMGSYFRELGSYLAIPVASEGSPLGVIQIGHLSENMFGEAEAHLAEAVAGIVASLFRRHAEFQAFTQVATVRTRTQAALFAIKEAPAVTLGEKGMVFFWEPHGDGRWLVPVVPGLLESKSKDERKQYYEKEGLTGWVGYYGIPLRITERTEDYFSREFEHKLKPALLKKGWLENDIRPPKWEELTKESVHTSRKSEDRPLLLVPIELNPDSPTSRPIGVIRVTDKTQGHFTEEDEKTLESFARVIALCHERDKYRSNFIQKAVYCMWPTMSAIAARCRSLSTGTSKKDDFAELESLVQYLDMVFRTLEYASLDTALPRKSQDVNLADIGRKVLGIYAIYARCMNPNKPMPPPESIFSVPDRPLISRTNGGLLEIAIFHLFDNAFKACRDTSNLRMAIVAAPHMHRRAEIRISDDGQGISEAHLKALGEIYLQHDYEQGNVPRGMGIGFYTAKGVILGDLGGDLFVTTKAGKDCDTLVRDFASGPSLKEATSAMASSGTIVSILLPTVAADA